MPTDLAHRFAGWVLGGLLLVLTGCTKTEDDRFPPYDNTEEVKAYWESQPEFFRWASAGDLPSDLQWQNGADVPEFGDPRAKKGGAFRYYTTSYPPTFRFFGPDGSNSFRREHNDNITIKLVTRHPDEDVWIPGLAKEWAVSEDRKTVYFRLRDHVTFSDGVPLEVEDFFMTFFVMRSPHIQDPWYNDWYTKEYSSITKYDDRTFGVTLPEAKPDPVWFAMMPPLPRHFFSEFGADFNARYQWRVTPTVGAYEIRPDLLLRGRRITLSRVKDWWARDLKHYRYLFNPDYLVYEVIHSPDKAFEMFLQGKLTFFLGGTPRYWYDKAENPAFYNGYIEKHQFYNEYPQVTWGLYLNQTTPHLDNLDVRIGFNHAMDFKAVLEVDFRGDKTRMQSTFSGFGRFTNPATRARSFDPQLAREHFARAGFTEAGPDGVLMNAEGERLSFTLSTFNSATVTPIMLRLKEGALKAGLEIVIEGLDGTQLYKKLDQKKHEVAFAGFGARPPYPRMWEYYHSDNAWEVAEDGSRKPKVDTNNVTMTDDPELDAKIDVYRFATTEEEKMKLGWEIQERVQELACAIPAWESSFYRYMSWRWLRWPERGNGKKSQYPEDLMMYWIDEELEQQTREAMKSGEGFGEVLNIHDHFRKQP